MECNHIWRRMREQTVFGSDFASGIKCELCSMSVPQMQVTPDMGGTMSTRTELMGAHGSRLITSDGKRCRRQVYDSATKELTYEGVSDG